MAHKPELHGKVDQRKVWPRKQHSPDWLANLTNAGENDLNNLKTWIEIFHSGAVALC